MKAFYLFSKKNGVLFVYLVLLFCSCDNESFDVILNELPAPSAVDAVITVENNGNVTIEPVATGATAFNIYFGEQENETPTTTGIRTTVANTYQSEGTFLAEVQAIAPNDKTTSVFFNIMVDILFFDFDAGIATSSGNSNEIVFMPVAEEAASFEIIFGDELIDEPEGIEILSGESISHTYPSGEFTAIITVNARADLDLAGMRSRQFEIPITIP